jgi:hypothetical protein
MVADFVDVHLSLRNLRLLNLRLLRSESVRLKMTVDLVRIRR